MYCSYCGVEISDPNQKICENCGTTILTTDTTKEVQKDTQVVNDPSVGNFIRKRRRWGCC